MTDEPSALQADMFDLRPVEDEPEEAEGMTPEEAEAFLSQPVGSSNETPAEQQRALDDGPDDLSTDELT